MTIENKIRGKRSNSETVLKYFQAYTFLYSIHPLFALFRLFPLPLDSLLYCTETELVFSSIIFRLFAKIDEIREQAKEVIELKGWFLCVLLVFFIRCQTLFIACLTLNWVFVV